MEMLRYCRTIGDVQLALGHLPQNLDAMYADTLRRMKDSPELDTARGIRILLWVVFAARPLKLDELQYVLATSPTSHQFDELQLLSEQSLVSLCHGLVTIESGTRCVRLVREWSYYSQGITSSQLHHRLYCTDCSRALAPGCYTGTP
jgi:hypothetical protein